MRKITIIISYIVLINIHLFAQNWQFLGLEGESISAIAVDWSNPNIIYAGSSSGYSSGRIGGIFKSINGGTVWDTLIRGVTVRDLDIHPKNTRIIYATLGLNVLTTPGIIKSEDGGTSWFWADSGIIKSWEEGSLELVIDPKNPDTLYTGTSGFYGGRFYKSVDGGKFWFSLGDSTRLHEGVTAIEIDPENTDVIYAGTAFNGNLLKSKDGGNTWQVTSLPEVGIVYDIEIDLKYINYIYCGAWLYGFYFSNDAGKTWKNYNDGLPDSITVYKIQVKDNRIFIVANWRDSGGIYMRESDSHWHKIGINGDRVNTILLNEQNIYAGYNGIYKKNILADINDKRIKTKKNKSIFLSNYPNPFNNTTIIKYQISSKSFIEIEIFDVLGRKQKTLLKESKNPGNYKLKFIVKDLASGIYIVQLKTEKEIIRRKMIKLR